MKNVERLLQGNEFFQKNYFCKHENELLELVSSGQHPKVLCLQVVATPRRSTHELLRGQRRQLAEHPTVLKHPKHIHHDRESVSQGLLPPVGPRVSQNPPQNGPDFSSFRRIVSGFAISPRPDIRPAPADARGPRLTRM